MEQNKRKLRMLNFSLAMMLGFFVSGFLFSAFAAQKSIQLFKLSEYRCDQSLDGWLLSEKLDGVRAYWDGQQLWTKNGNPIYAPKWFINDFPPFELDGELWIARQHFEELTSVVLDQNPSKEWSKVTYQIFEVPNQPGGLLKRLNVLEEYLMNQPVSVINVITQTPAINHEYVDRELKRLSKLGAEGVVIRDGRLPYLVGRQSRMQKVKLKQDAECVVKGYTEGKGKYNGQMGAVLCELIPEQVARLFPKLDAGNPEVIKVGTGFSDLQRKHPPKIGSKITFQYRGLTRKGLPRFVSFLRERESE